MSQESGYAPPPRSGKPWWVWALGGCGGCLLVVVLGVVALGVIGFNMARRSRNNQQMYQKGQAIFMVQEQPRRDAPSGTLLVLMRGGPGTAASDSSTPTTPEAVEKSLGVPIYPGATLNVQATEMTRSMAALTRRLSGKVSFGAAGAYTTPDRPDQVAAFYKTNLTAAGWRMVSNPMSAGGESPGTGGAP